MRDILGRSSSVSPTSDRPHPVGERATGPLDLGVWAHPLSFQDEPERMAALIAAAGFSHVRLAANYHGGRWLLTTSRPANIAYLRGGQATFDFEASAYDRRLAPSPRTDECGNFAPAVAALRAEGVVVHAWVVGLHADALAESAKDLTLRNVMGDRLLHALCPSQASVVDYLAALCHDVSTQAGVTGIDLEAAGFLGWPHGGEHDKTGFRMSTAAQYLMSLCVCQQCAIRFTAAGLDVDELSRRARTWLSRHLFGADHEERAVQTVADILGKETASIVDEVRSQVGLELVRRVRAETPKTALSVRATSVSTSFAGKTYGNLGRLAAEAGGLTLSNLDNNIEVLTDEVDSALTEGVDASQITASINLTDTRLDSADDLPALTEPLRNRGVRQLTFYAFDLASPRRLEWPANLLTRATPKITRSNA